MYRCFVCQVAKVNAFFETASDGSLFVVQADLMSATMRRIQHARYILENARARFIARTLASHVPEEVDEKDPLPEKAAPAPGAIAGIHVVLLVHLPRNENSFSFDFDHRWKYVFVDSIEPPHSVGLPTLQDMLGSDFASIIGKLDLQQVLIKTFRTSMSRLVYNYQRTTDDVRNQILYLLHRLESQGANFLLPCKTLLSELVHQSDAALDLFAIAANDRDLALAGTFQVYIDIEIFVILTRDDTVLLLRVCFFFSFRLRFIAKSLTLYHTPLLQF
jgi:hypothetical protein